MEPLPSSPDNALPADLPLAGPGARPRRGILGRMVRLVATIALFLIGYLLVAPSPVDPAAYDPPVKPALAGPTAPNEVLRQAEVLAVGYPGPEDVYVDPQGNVYSGLVDGRIIRVLPDGKVEVLVDTGGRPLGMEIGPQGDLIVADGVRGLLSVPLPNPTPESIKVLTTTVDGKPFGFTDDLAVASDGTVYFSDASSKFHESEYIYDLLESRPHGAVLSYHPATGETKVVLDDLYFANGVALSRDEDFLIVNETYRYRITRYWLKGEKAGTAEPFIENLPGFPDNASSNGQGTFWVALFTVRNDLVDGLHPHPWVKSLIAKLPKSFWPSPQPYGFVIAVDEQGQIIKSFQDPSGENLNTVTSAYERDNYLYLGSLINDRIGKFKLP